MKALNGKGGVGAPPGRSMTPSVATAKGENGKNAPTIDPTPSVSSLIRFRKDGLHVDVGQRGKWGLMGGSGGGGGGGGGGYNLSLFIYINIVKWKYLIF